MSMYEYIGEIPGKINDQNAERQSIVDLLGYEGAAVTGKHELNDNRVRPGFGLMVDGGSYYDVADIVRNIATLKKACCLDTLTAADATSGVAPTDSIAGTPIKVKAESVHTQADAGTQTISAPKAITGNDTIIITNTNGVDTDTYTLTPAATLYGLSTATDHIQADTGVVTRQTKLVILDGTETWTGDTTPYVLTLTDKAAGTTNFICSHSITAASGTTQGTCVGHAVNTTVSFNAPTGAAYDTLTEWKAVLLAASTGANPVQLLYEIADTTENIGPTFVTALSGTNTITHDGGGAITINYYRDINDLTDTVDALDVMTTRGDIIYQGASAPARLAKGTAGYALVQGANDPAWAKGDSIIITDTNSKFTTDTIKGALDELSTYDVITAQGDIMIGTTGGAPAVLVKGTAGYVVKQGAAEPEWGKPGDLAITDTNTKYTTDTIDGAFDALGLMCVAASTSAQGFVPQATAPSAGLRNVVAIDNAETAYTNKALFDATAPTTQTYSDAAAVGTAMTAARRDHKHAMPAFGGTAASVTVADAGGYFASDNAEGVLQELGPVLDDNLILTTATLPDTDAELFEGLKVYDTTTDQQLWCKVPGEQEVNTLTVTGAPTKAGLNDITIALHGVDVAVEVDGGTRDVHLATITAGATGDGNITFTLDSAAKVIGVLTGDSASDVAGKVTAALAADADWTVGNVGADITFTAKVSEVKSGTFTFEDTGTTGVTCTGGVTSSVVGVAGDDIDATATKIKQETYTGWTTSGTVPTVIFTKDTVGAGAAPTFTDTDGTGVTIDGAAITQTNPGVTTVWSKGPTVWTAWTPVLSWTGGPPTVTSTVARYITNGTTCFFNVYSVISDGKDATALTVPLPVAPVNNSSYIAVNSLELVDATWTSPQAYISDGATEVAFYGLAQLTNTKACKIILTGQYEIA